MTPFGLCLKLEACNFEEGFNIWEPLCIGEFTGENKCRQLFGWHVLTTAFSYRLTELLDLPRKLAPPYSSTLVCLCYNCLSVYHHLLSFWGAWEGSLESSCLAYPLGHILTGVSLYEGRQRRVFKSESQGFPVTLFPVKNTWCTSLQPQSISITTKMTFWFLPALSKPL